MDFFEQPEESYGDKPEHTVVDREFETRCNRRQNVLDLGAGIKARRDGSRFAGRYNYFRSVIADDVAAFTNCRRIVMLADVVRRNDRGKEIMLDQCGPATSGVAGDGFVGEIVEVEFLILLLWTRERSHGEGRRGH